DRRPGHHQPAGDHHPLGPLHRAAGLQRHRMAVPPDRSPLRHAEGRRPGPPGGGADGPADRR
ncbi:DUF6774 domain-containing protein, partial [Dysosmobacter welbionis]